MKLGYNNAETREKSKEWRHSGSTSPKNFKTQKSLSKVLASVFCNRDGILLRDYLEKGEAITTKYYVTFLDKLKQQLVTERQGKLPKGILSFKTMCSSNGGHYTPENSGSSL
jgi:hypothetical protein